MSVEPCRCEGPNESCLRSGKPMLGRLFELCKGLHCEPGRSDAYRRHWDGLPQEFVEYQRQRVPCVMLGGESGEVNCKTCNGNVRQKTYHCSKHGQCSPYARIDGKPWCQTCPDFQTPDKFFPKDGDVSCGVVVGSYGYPNLIELQIKVIRNYCGDVPILISDDLSPGDRVKRIRDLAAKYPNVDVQVSSRRIGHAGGDMAAFHRGIIWGASKGLRVIAKISHRFFVTWPRWLQEGAKDLVKSRRPIGGQPCIEGKHVFPLRTESVLMDVHRWHTPQILQYLTPRKISVACEGVVWGANTMFLKSEMWPWPVITRDRFKRTPGVLWHICTPEAEYHALASRFGITLDPDFNVGGNHLRKDYIVG